MMKYKLLPFTFSRISSKEVLVNELGDMLAVPDGTVQAVVEHKIDTKSDLYKSLVANFFLTERTIPALIDVYAERLAEKKRFMDDGTALHIFVLTLRCNQNCVYCQARDHEHVHVEKMCDGGGKGSRGSRRIQIAGCMLQPFICDRGNGTVL